MSALFNFLAAGPVLVLFLLIGIGMAFGHIKVKGVNLGAAAVLFIAIALSAWGEVYGIHIRVPHEIGIFGLAIFTFAIGIYSGPNFFNTLRTSGGPILVMVVALGTGAAIAFGVGRYIFDLSAAEFAGVFAGATNNTPALAAAGKSSGDPANATVGYSISYLWGVIGMLIYVSLALRLAKGDKDKPTPIVNRTIRIERTDEPVLEQYHELVSGRVSFSRLRRGETGPIFRPGMFDKLRHNDLLTIVGPEADIDLITERLGHDSSLSLTIDRQWLDFRRITVSNPKLAGRKLGELNLNDEFGAMVSRVRRGDIDVVANSRLRLQLGDRVRVVAPRAKMDALSAYFGDSSRGLTSLNPVALGIGMAVGILIGELPIFTPTGATFSIGSAAGTLIVGLIFGRLGRVGPMVTALPYTTCMVLSEFGLLIFLAQAGTNAGGQIANAFEGGVWWKMAILGFLITTAVGGILFAGMRMVFKMGGTRLSGAIGGTQTQPAVLAFANERTGADPRVALGYAMVYPVAMVLKILTAQLLGAL
ncbi:aspartate:alanine exchanger family transporter [Boudabousia marimammalium]|uniref:Transporter n=1 Tax=Boudabousia marimammalium TaxID=156892 RepID=A0A1Q5PP46_9ACTO|nr:TrkA C-terminal domain-containing protein [Boudabousia marimammalium]OKL49368.1 transporter [Boudabousia marimammalium]